MKKTLHAILFLILTLIPTAALAGEGVTLIFRSGQVVTIEDGYGTIVRAMESLDKAGDIHRIVKLNIAGSNFLVDVSEVVVACRDDCRQLEIKHQLDPSRGKR